MKLKAKILLLVLLPILIIGTATYIVGSVRITSVVKDIVHKELEAMAELVRDDCSLPSGNAFFVDENGDLWNGKTMNVSQSVETFDSVRASSGAEITIFYGDTRYVTTVTDDSGKRVLGTKASDAVISMVLNGGQDYFAENVDVVGEKFFAYYLPLYNAASTNPIGMVFVGMSQEKLQAEINAILFGLLGIILVVALACAAVAVIVTGRIVQGVKSGVAVAHEVAKGNLGVQVDESKIGKDEVGDMLRNVVVLKNELIDVVSDIVDKSHSLTAAAQSLNNEAQETKNTVEQVEKAMSEVADGATSQAEETQKATENVIVIGNMVEETSKEAESLNHNAGEMRRMGEQANATLGELEEINAKTKDAIDVIYHQTNTTNESAMKIREATSLITSIAEETNLLSLNASIEAARAGEQGRGFAVVAGQIQKLAEQSNESARAIETIIDELITDSEKAVATMDDVRQIMTAQSDKVEATGRMFAEVMEGIGQSINGVTTIAEHTANMDEARIKVVDIVQNLTAIAQENAASTEETSASVTVVNNVVSNISGSAAELNEIASALQASVGFFKV